MPKLFIHDNPEGFSLHWINYCNQQSIDHDAIDVYSEIFWNSVERGDILMWHFTPSDLKAGKMLLSLEMAGVQVFPNSGTRFGFDDKLSQAFFAKIAGEPFAETPFFLIRQEAERFVDPAEYPLVAKLASGAGSQNVYLFKEKLTARKWVRKLFSKGVFGYSRSGILRWRLYQFKGRQIGLQRVLSAAYRFLVMPSYIRRLGREHGYALFQRFIPGNDYDIRVVVIDSKAFGITRRNRPGDFRASASGFIDPNPKNIPTEAVSLCFSVAKRLGSDCCAFDILQNPSGKFEIIEFCYGFTPAGYSGCPGYWDSNLVWHDERFDQYGWMVELMLRRTNYSVGESHVV